MGERIIIEEKTNEILLTPDDCAAHAKLNLKLMTHQPMDQGVIRSLKCYSYMGTAGSGKSVFPF